MNAALKRLIVRLLPLAFRKRLAIWLNRQAFIGKRERAYWATELLVDFASADPNAYHKFLWEHHLAYAETYEIELRFGYENLNETRKLLFAELPDRIVAAGIGSPDEVSSIFEVGCSLGYLLRYMETDVFPKASRLEGIDIDRQAVTRGARHLAGLGSKVKLHYGDMESLEDLLDDSRFDIVLASGVLLYLDADSARSLVRLLLRYTRKLLVITALADLTADNAYLVESRQRANDGTWIHNVDEMIKDAGGSIVARRWQGGELVDGNTIYFLYATPEGARESL